MRMSEFKGTPGPWRYEAYSGSINPIVGIGPRVICSESLADHDNGKIALEANASLMAAAPDLLESLVDCVERFTEAFPDAENYEPIKKARAAIAKALGEEK